MDSHNKHRLETQIIAAKKANGDTVGKLEYLYSGKSIRYTEPDKLIKAYKESINIYGINGVNVKVVEGNIELAYEICKIQYGEFGEEPPLKEEFYKNYNKKLDVYAR